MARKNSELLETYDIKTWMTVHVNQLAFARNVLIVLATAISGFTASLMFGDSRYEPYMLIMLCVSTLVYLASIIVGVRIIFRSSENYRNKWKASRLAKRKAGSDDGLGIDNDVDFLVAETTCTTIERSIKKLSLWHSWLFITGIFLSGVLLVVYTFQVLC